MKTELSSSRFLTFVYSLFDPLNFLIVRAIKQPTLFEKNEEKYSPFLEMGQYK